MISFHCEFQSRYNAPPWHFGNNDSDKGTLVDIHYFLLDILYIMFESLYRLLSDKSVSADTNWSP